MKKNARSIQGEALMTTTIQELETGKVWTQKKTSNNVEELKLRQHIAVESLAKEYGLKGKFHANLLWEVDGVYHSSDSAMVVFDDESKLSYVEMD